jgi:hypothetical protein
VTIPETAGDPLAQLWQAFAEGSCRGYSPIYERVSSTVASDPELLALVREAPPLSHQPHLLLAAVHDLVLRGTDHPLAAVYAGVSDADPGPLFRDLCLARRDDVLELVCTRHVQTNEIGRSALIAPALAWVAERFDRPVILVDVGTSAGLNLLCDRYRLDYGAMGATGPEDAGVPVHCDVLGGAPPIRPWLPMIAARLGIDRDPVDLHDPDDARWLEACVWPDTGRLARTQRAIELARAEELEIRRGDALAVLPEVVAGLPDDGVVCLVTTWVFAYFLADDRRRLVDLLTDLGRDRRLVWIAADSPGVVDDVVPGPARPEPARDVAGERGVLSAVCFEGGGLEKTTLAFVHPHGAWLSWEV